MDKGFEKRRVEGRPKHDYMIMRNEKRRGKEQGSERNPGGTQVRGGGKREPDRVGFNTGSPPVRHPA